MVAAATGSLIVMTCENFRLIRSRVDMSLQLASPIISLDLNSQGIVQKIA